MKRAAEGPGKVERCCLLLLLRLLVRLIAGEDGGSQAVCCKSKSSVGALGGQATGLQVVLVLGGPFSAVAVGAEESNARVTGGSSRVRRCGGCTGGGCYCLIYQ